MTTSTPLSLQRENSSCPKVAPETASQGLRADIRGAPECPGTMHQAQLPKKECLHVRHVHLTSKQTPSSILWARKPTHGMFLGLLRQERGKSCLRMGEGLGCVQAAGGHEQPMCNASLALQILACYSITSPLPSLRWSPPLLLFAL